MNDRSAPPARIITLLTDFGTQDAYVGAMKGVILSLCPAVQLVDLTHEIPAQDVEAAGWQLFSCYRYFPPGTVHLVVVDPGVGTARRPILVTAGNYSFVAPDNGVLSPILHAEKVSTYVLDKEEFFLEKVSATFHGRDIFAPVAARLACGMAPEKLGRRISDEFRFPAKVPQIDGHVIRGEALFEDRFGNLITNIPEDLFRTFARSRPFAIGVGDVVLRSLHRTYGEAPDQDIVALFGSAGFLEIAEVSGNAAKSLKAVRGMPVTVTVEEQVKKV